MSERVSFATAQKILLRFAARALRELPRVQKSHRIPGGAAIEFAILPHREMERLKRRHLVTRRSPSAADAHHFPNVLSFPTPKRFPSPPRMRPVLGEVYVNERVVRDEGIPRAAYLLLHGILHCAGYRHARNRDMLQMERMEKRLMRKIFRPRT